MSSSDEPVSSESAARAEQVVKLLASVVSLAYSLWLIWFLIPEHQKKLFLMRLSRAIQNAARQQACRAARPAMRAEVRSGVRNYLLPYSLMLLAERAQRAYDRWRNV